MRASEYRRQRTLAALRLHALEGELPLDSFAARVVAARHARTREELELLLEDLPARGVLPGRVGRAARRLVRAARRPAAGQMPAEIEVRLPRSVGAVTVGRSSACDVVVGERSVSRVHAELRHGDRDAWTVRDLDSTNGTWVNGARVEVARVERGDVLSLGGLRMELRL